MATVTRGTTYGATESITNTKLHTLVDSATVTSIVNADVASNAAIAYSKLNLTGNIADADISASAAIVASKLSLVSPGGIGTTTPAAGKFTTLEATTTLKLGTTNQGDILYDNGTSLVRLTPGTSGQVLKTNGAAANPAWTSLLDVRDYGTSASSSTQKALAGGTIKIAYGQITLSTGLAQITNLGFTSSSSYQVTIARVNSSDVSQAVQVKSYDSASAFTIRDSLNGSAVVSWIAIGT